MLRFRGFEISRFQSGVVRLGRVESEFEFRFEQCCWEKQILYTRPRQGNLMRWQNIGISFSHHELMMLRISDSYSGEVRRGEI
jgi:hypothetical protein